jgi:hypothetical protein
MTTTTEQEYTVAVEGSPTEREYWPKTVEGLMTAIDRGHQLSRKGPPAVVLRPDGRVLARFLNGRRTGP